ncbi:MFS transporter, partial [Shewanella sp. SR44-3]|uniref:MFS transporter n=1 Tax=Shewanella sp. SR44-3 TaxID=2760936 RepID=UPI0015FCE96A
AGEIADSVRYAFYFGAVVLFIAVSWTVVSSKEYSPAELEAFHQAEQAVNPALDKVNPSHMGEGFGRRSAAQYQFGALIFAIIGGLFTAAVYLYQLDKQLYILSIGILAFAPMQYYCAFALQKTSAASKNIAAHGKTTLPTGMLFNVVDDMFAMPEAMKQLALVQFFAWFALFAMWIYTTAAVTSYHYGSADVLSKQFNDGADWVGILFASYNGFAALAAICIPFLAKWLGVRLTHTVNMFLGGSGLISFYFISDPSLLWLPMIGVGFAWASILSVPYALLSGALPPQKMGVYMGIFNFFIVIPQLLAASILGLLLKTFFNGEPIYALVLGGVFMMLSGIAVLFVEQDNS